jgi:WD40 repeat protein
MKFLIYIFFVILIVPLYVISAQNAEVFETGVSETRAVAISDDDKLAAYGSYKKIFIIDMVTKESVMILEGATGDIYDIVFVGDRLLATGGKYFGIWNVKTGKPISISEREEYTYRLSVCRKTNMAYVGGTFIEGWNIRNGKSVMKTEKFSDDVESFALSPDGKSLYVSVKWANSILILDAKTGKQKEELTNISRAKQVLFHPNGKSLFIWQFGKKIKHVNLKGELIQEIGPSMPSYGQISISKNGEYLLMPTWSTPRDNEQVIIYDIRAKKIAAELDISDKSIYEAEMTSDNKFVVAAPKDKMLHFIEFNK